MSWSRRRYSTRLYLVAFSLALVLPLMGLGAAVLFYYAAVERTRLEGQAAEWPTRWPSSWTGTYEQVALLKGLSTAPALSTGDLATFHLHTARAVHGSDSIIVFRTFDGRQLMNTQVPVGQPLPPAVSPITLREGNGIMAAGAIMRSSPARVIFVSGNSDPKTLAAARALAGAGFIRKPFGDNLALLVAAALALLSDH